MSESVKKEAKRLFEILREMGYIEEVGRKVSSSMECLPTVKLEMRLSDKEAWIRVLTEAIAIYKAEELEETFKKAGVKKPAYGRGGAGGR